MVIREALQVTDPLVTTREAPRSPAYVVSGQRRHPAEGVEPQSLVAHAPARADAIRSFEDEAAHPSRLERGRRREPCGPGAADDRVKPICLLGPVARPLHVVAAN